jgi:hypothetical protein
MCTCNSYCPKCDSGIEAFYQQKVEEAKKAAVHLKSTGVEVHYEDLLDAKDIWYEYCDLRAQEAADELGDQRYQQELDATS